MEIIRKRQTTKSYFVGECHNCGVIFRMDEEEFNSLCSIEDNNINSGKVYTNCSECFIPIAMPMYKTDTKAGIQLLKLADPHTDI